VVGFTGGLRFEKFHAVLTGWKPVPLCQSKHLRHAFVEDFQARGQLLLRGNFLEPARRLVQRLERQLERAVVHRHKNLRAQIAERLHRLVRPHVDFAERLRVIRADGQQRDFRREPLADFREAVEIRAVAGVVNFSSLMLQHESAVTAMLVVQCPRTPVRAGRERHLPVALRKSFPPVQLHDAGEAEVAREIADAPRHHADFRRRQPAQRRLVKMIEVRVREQNQINRRQIADAQAGALEPLQQEKPVREIRVHQHVQVRELDEKRRVADPGDGDLLAFQLGKNRWPRLARALGEPAFPDQLPKKRARVEVLCRRQILERARQLAARRHGTVGSFFRHNDWTLAPAARSTNFNLPAVVLTRQRQLVSRRLRLWLNNRVLWQGLLARLCRRGKLHPCGANQWDHLCQPSPDII